MRPGLQTARIACAERKLCIYLRGVSLEDFILNLLGLGLGLSWGCGKRFLPLLLRGSEGLFGVSGLLLGHNSLSLQQGCG